MGSQMALQETPEQAANPPRIYSMTAADRCDTGACGARAYVRVIMPRLTELNFCGHHSREVEGTLRPIARIWHDETDALKVRLEASA